ncbi:MAG: hypothetical protein QOD04_4896 [Pseudonocardiales bacterium]|nr:hypothetical protein [Pseudonocardiales bacterium]
MSGAHPAPNRPPLRPPDGAAGDSVTGPDQHRSATHRGKLIRRRGDQPEHVQQPPAVVRVVSVARHHDPSAMDLILRDPVRVGSTALGGNRRRRCLPGVTLIRHLRGHPARSTHQRLPVDIRREALADAQIGHPRHRDLHVTDRTRTLHPPSRVS